MDNLRQKDINTDKLEIKNKDAATTKIELRKFNGKKSEISHEIDMIHGTIWNKLLCYALPLAATGILQQLFNAADVAVVGQFVGPEAMAAVGANSSLIGLIINLFVGISLGTNVIIANAIGQKNYDIVHKAVHTSVIIAVIGGFVVLICGEIFAGNILALMKVPDKVLPMAVLYLRVYLIGEPVILLYDFESAIMRGVGNTRTPLIALAISGCINVVLNLFFVIVIGMTVDGVATATVISNVISSMFLLYSLIKSKSEICIRRKELKIDCSILKKIMRIGIPAGVQGGVFSFANIVIQTAINGLGTIVMAASSAAYNIEIFAYDVLNSFSQACTTFVGQNHGAGNEKRCRKILATTIFEDLIATIICITIILIFGKEILSVFNHNKDVINTGYQRLVIIFSAYTFSMLY